MLVQFTMEGRILKPVPAELRVKMDELVHDLTQALEETSCSSSVKIKASFRRRARSAGNVNFSPTSQLLASSVAGYSLFTVGGQRTVNSSLVSKTSRVKSKQRGVRLTEIVAWGIQRATFSDDSISERIHSRGKEVSSFVQSDSDEVSTNSQKRFVPFPLQKRSSNLQQNFESDSVNENNSPLRTGTRRKRKLKRMDIDSVDTNLVPPRPISSIIAKPISAIGFGCKGGPVPGPSGLRNNIAKKKKFLKNPPVQANQRFETLIGKRKRSARERSTDFEMGSSLTKSSRLQRGLRDDAMELDRELMSSSSLSSSESDAGVYTNDEGREGDDEQSDWFGETRPDEDTDLEQDDPAIQSILNASLDRMSSDARQAYKERINWLKEGFGEREIRGGRRRVRNLRPGFAVLTSANEKLSRFLQDHDQVTLRLHAMEREEREQLTYLVNMYSLNMRVEHGVNGESCPVISKTNGTPQTVRVENVKMNVSDYNKRRKIPQYTEDDSSLNTFIDDVMKS